MPSKKIRVLVIAEAANPEWTSVPLLGWLHTLALSKACDVHLVTNIRNKEAIERFGWQDNHEFTAIDSEKLAAPMYKLSNFLRGGQSLAWTISTALESIAYPYFEYVVWKRFKEKLKNKQFDIVHRITPVSPTAPSYLASKLKKIDVPLIVGPLNGGVPWPKEFSETQRSEKEWLTALRGAYRLLPGATSLKKNAAAILAGSMATKQQTEVTLKEKLFYIPENAVSPERFALKNNSDYTLPLRAAFVGRLVPYKGADMAIEAMESLIKSGMMEYDIYGEGVEFERLNEMVKAKGLDGKVRLHGFVKNTELQQKLVTADLLVFPSIREFGGGVVLEAMALGVVPVIADYAGPAELVTKDSGFRIAMGNREQLIDNFKKCLTKITNNPHVLTDKRACAMQRIATYYTWEKKVEQDLRVYTWALGEGSRPEFDSPDDYP